MRNKDLFISPKKMKSYIDSQLNRMLKDKDLKASQIPFIMEVGSSEGVSMKELCTQLGVDKALTTRVIKTLMENGYVENRSGSSRTYQLFLTKKGKEAKRQSVKAMESTFDQLLECLDEKDIEDTRRITAKLNHRLDELYKY